MPSKHIRLITLSSVIVITIFLDSFSYAQKSNSLEGFVNPFIYRMGDITKQYTELDNEFITANYYNSPSFEVGVQYYHKFESNWGWCTGITGLRSKHELFFNLKNPQSTNVTLSSINKTIATNYLSLRLGGTYSINNSIRIGIFVNAYVAQQIKLNPELNVHETRFSYEQVEEPDTSYSALLYYYDTKITNGVFSPYIMPEFSIDFDILKDVSITFGVKWLFWRGKYDQLLTVDVQGITSHSENPTIEPLHFSQIKIQGLYSYFGLKYNLPLSSNKLKTNP